MGIFNKMSRVVRSNLNALLDDLEAPDKKIDQIVADMKDALKQARKELVTTLGTSKRLDKKREEQEREAEEWEQKAILALENGDEELAKEALRRKQRATKDAQRTAELAAQQATAADEMKDTLERIEHKIEDVKARRTTLAAQVRQARAKPEPDVVGSTVGTPGGAFSDLEQMVDRVDQLEAEVEAHQVLDSPSRAALDKKFRELEKDDDEDQIQDELAALKAKLS